MIMRVFDCGEKNARKNCFSSGGQVRGKAFWWIIRVYVDIAKKNDMNGELVS